MMGSTQAIEMSAAASSVTDEEAKRSEAARKIREKFKTPSLYVEPTILTRSLDRDDMRLAALHPSFGGLQ
jgi:hypothetical protein